MKSRPRLFIATTCAWGARGEHSVRHLSHRLFVKRMVASDRLPSSCCATDANALPQCVCRLFGARGSKCSLSSYVWANAGESERLVSPAALGSGI